MLPLRIDNLKINVRMSCYILRLFQVIVFALLTLVLPGKSFSQDTLTSTQKTAIIRKYLTAMCKLDVDAMLPYRHEQYTRIARDGKQSLNDLQFERNMTGFEKSVSTKWTFKIVSLNGDTATVYETEDSKWYNLIGAGLRTQTIQYILSGNKLTAYKVITVDNAKGDYRTLVHDFITWLKTTEAKDDKDIFDGEGSLLFSAKSGEKLTTYLKRWNTTTQHS